MIAAEESVNSLIDQCLDEFDAKWQAGLKPTALEFLDRFQGREDDFIEMIYHEFCCAEADGGLPEADDFLVRYSTVAESLKKLFAVHFGVEFGERSQPGFKIDPSPKPGDQIGAFTLVKMLGLGAQGRVFLARQGDLGDRLVVLKFSPNVCREKTDLQARLAHPNVMGVIGQFVTEDQGFQVAVMPWLPGASLDRLIHEPGRASNGSPRHVSRRSRPKPIDFRLVLENTGLIDELKSESMKDRGTGPVLTEIPWETQVARWGIQIAEALDAFYRKGVIHGDVKPGNIYFDERLTPYLLDFHLARQWRYERHRKVFSERDPGGTLHYMPPERLKRLYSENGRKTAEREIATRDVNMAHRGDLYSLGIVLMELLTGFGPADLVELKSDDFRADSALLARMREDDLFLMDWPGFRYLSKPWQRILKKLLSADPSGRHVDGRSLAEDLNQIAMPGKITSKKLGSKRLSRSLAAALAISFLLLGTSVFGVYVRAERKKYENRVNSLCMISNQLWNDPSETLEIRPALKIRQARQQWEQARQDKSDLWEEGPQDWIYKPKTARLDAEIWLIEQVDLISKALAQRVQATKNRDDLAMAESILEFGMSRWKCSVWEERFQGLSPRHQAAGIPKQLLIPETVTVKWSSDIINKFLKTLDTESEDNRAISRQWKSILAMAPDSFGLRSAYARYLVSIREKQEAIGQLKQAVAINPAHFESWRLLAFLEVDSGDYKSAFRDIEAALKLRSDDISALRLQLMCRVESGQWEQLDSELTRLGSLIDIEQQPFKKNVGELLGNANDSVVNGSNLLDIETVERLHKTLPDDRKIKEILMHRYFENRRMHDAIVLSEELVKWNPDSLAHQFNRAVFYLIDGQVEKSCRQIERLIDHPKLGEYLMRDKPFAGFLIYSIGMFEEKNLNVAKSVCDKLIKMPGDFGVGKGEIHFIMARILLRTGGEESIQKALEHLVISGQQNEDFLRAWYFKDPVFQKYHASFDKTLSGLFPNIYSIADIQQK